MTHVGRFGLSEAQAGAFFIIVYVLLAFTDASFNPLQEGSLVILTWEVCVAFMTAQRLVFTVELER